MNNLKKQELVQNILGLLFADITKLPALHPQDIYMAMRSLHAIGETKDEVVELIDNMRKHNPPLINPKRKCRITISSEGKDACKKEARVTKEQYESIGNWKKANDQELDDNDFLTIARNYKNNCKKLPTESSKWVQQVAFELKLRVRQVENQALGLDFLRNPKDESKGRKNVGEQLKKAYKEVFGQDPPTPENYGSKDDKELYKFHRQCLSIYHLIRKSDNWNKQRVAANYVCNSSYREFYRYVVKHEKNIPANKNNCPELQSQINQLSKDYPGEEKKAVETINSLFICEQIDRDKKFKRSYEETEEKRAAEDKKAPVKQDIREFWQTHKSDTSFNFQSSPPPQITEEWVGSEKITTSNTGRSKESKYIINSRQEDFKPAYQSFSDLTFIHSQLVIPCYQRGYSWNETNLQQLEKDVFSNNWEDKRETFLGTVLLQEASHGNNKFVLDGQQRIMTFGLVIAWICQTLVGNNCEEHALELAKSTIGKWDNRDEHFTARLTPDRKDTEAWRKIMERSTLQEWKWDSKLPTTKQSSALTKQFDAISNLFGARRVKNGIITDWNSFTDLAHRILHQCFVCRFVLKSNEDPFDTFQRLNHRGVKLENADIIRSIVLQKAGDRADKFYDSYWLDFEEYFKEDTSRSNKKDDQEISPNDQTKFIKSQLDSFYTTYAKISRPQSKKSSAVSELEIYWKNKEHIEGAKEILEELEVYAPYYKLLTQFSQTEVQEFKSKFKSKLMSLIWILQTLKPADEFLPFLTNLLHHVKLGKCKLRSAEQAAELLCSWQIRNSVINPGSLQGLQAIFSSRKNDKSFWERYESEKYSIDHLIDELKPHNNAFSFNELTDSNFKSNLTDRTTNFYSKAYCHAVLLTYEMSLQPFDLTSKEKREPAQIEHILPQKLPAEGETNYEDWKHIKNHKDLVDNLGNLTLLEQRLQGAAGRKGFLHKCEEYKNYARYLTCIKLTNLQHNPEWKNDFKQLWSTESIHKYQDDIADKVVEYLPFELATKF